MEYIQTVTMWLLASALFYAGFGIIVFVIAIVLAIIDWRRK